MASETKTSKPRPRVCKNCGYWKDLGEGKVGECQRFPPQVVLLSDGGGDVEESRILSVRPSMAFSDFCGEFEPKFDA